MALRYNKKLVIIMIMLILLSCTSCGVKQSKDKQEVKKNECAEMQLFEYPTQYSQVSGNHYFYLRKNAKGDYILHQDGNTEILSFRLSKQKLRGFAVWHSQYYVLVRNEVGTLQFGKVDRNSEVDILCDVYAQKEICSIILYDDSLFVCENNSNIIERQSINGQTRTPISLDADSDDISFFGSEKMGGICAMDVRKNGKIEVVVFDWQGNRKRTLHSQMELQDNSNLPKGKGGIYVDKIIDNYICFTYYCGEKYFAGRMNLDTNRTETLQLSSEEVCDTSFAAEGVYFVSQDRTISYQEWGKNSSQKISELQAEEIDIVGEWLYVRGYSKEWEFLEDSDEEASDEWSDALYRIHCSDGKFEKLEENNLVDETEVSETSIPDINAQSEGVKMICADRTAKFWQVSEGKCYTMQSDGDRNYIVLCNGNTIGGFSLSDGYIAGLVRYKKEFYALRICASEYTDKDTKFEEAIYKWSIGKIDFKNNAFVEIFNASESRSEFKIPDAYDVCVYKDKIILYYQDKIHIWNMKGKKNKAVINTPHLPQESSEYTVYDNKIFYGLHDENKINLYYFDMRNNMEKKFYSFASKNAVQNCSVSIKFDNENLYVSNCMVNRQDGTKKQIFNNAVKDGEDVLFSCTNKNIYYLDKERQVHKINKVSLADTIVYKKKASDVQTSKDCLFIKKYDEELEPDYETDYGEIQNWDVPDKCKVVRMSERVGKAVQVGKINKNMADCPDVNVNNYFQSVCDASQYSQVANGNYYYLRMDKTKNKYCVYKNGKKILTFTLGNQERLIAFVRYKNAFYFVKQRDDDWEDLFNIYSATICRISEESQRPEVCFEWKTRIGFLVTLEEQSSFFNKCFLSGGKFCFVRRNFFYGFRLTDGKLVDLNSVSKGTKK